MVTFRGEREQRGISLIEVLVGVVIAGLLSMAFLNTFTRSSNVLATTTDTNEVTGNVSIGMSYVMNTLSTATQPLPDAGILAWPQTVIQAGKPMHYQRAANNDTEASFFASTKKFGVVLVHWYINESHQFVQDYISCQPDCGKQRNHATPPLESRVILNDVIVPAAGQRPIFSWFSAGSTTRDQPDATGCVPNVTFVSGVYVSISVYPASALRPRQAESFKVLRTSLADAVVTSRWTNTPQPPEPAPNPSGPGGPGSLGPAPSTGPLVGSSSSGWPTFPPTAGYVHIAPPGFVGVS